MADILDAAQQQINAAAGGPPPAGDVPASDPTKPADPVAPATPSEAPKTETPTAEPTKPADDMPLPPEKPLVVPASGTPMPEPAPSAGTPTPAAPVVETPATETPAAQASVNINIGSTPPPEPAPPAPVAPSHTPPKKSGKSGSKLAVIVGIIMLLFSLPAAVFFVSNQQQVAELRSKADCTCDGFAKCGETHDNTQDCKKYRCDNGSWTQIGEATHPECGGGGGGNGGGGNGGGGGGDDIGPPQCANAYTCVRRINGVNTPVDNSECAGKLCGSTPDITKCSIKSCPSGQIPTDFADNGCPGRCVNSGSTGGGGGSGGGGGGGGSSGGGGGGGAPTCQSCFGMGGGPEERECLQNCTGSLGTGSCGGSTSCEDICAQDPSKCQICTGTQENGEFKTCGQSSTGGCGQIDICSESIPAGGTCPPDKVVGIKWDKTNCAGATGGGGGGGGGGDDKKKEKKKLACQKLRIFKAGKKVDEKDWPKLKAGDAIQFVVDHQEAKKARVRVNGAAWTETTKKKDGDYIVDFTIPAGTTTFTIEAEVNKKGDQWK